MLLSLQNVCYTADDTQILRDISLDIGKEDFITIVGPNGAGKSSLLKLIAGIHVPSQGTITRPSPVTIGYVPQRFHPTAIMPLSVQDFLFLKRTPDKETLAQAVEDVQLRIDLTRPVHQLSSGELQRVLLIRALLSMPDLLLLDEPAQQLDIQGQLQLYSLIERIYEQRRCSIVMISHDLHVVMASTNKVICLYHHICCSGTPQHVASDPEFIALFGSDVAKLMAVYHHHHDHDHPHE